MINVFILYSFLITIIYFPSQSLALPPCLDSGEKHNCYGTSIDKLGKKYIGEWKNNLKNGKGKETVNNGFYIGNWENGRPNGYGVFTFNVGHIYDGQFLNGFWHGYATFTWGKGAYEGDKYEGQFRIDKKHGEGIYTRKNGSTVEGIWKDDILIEMKKIKKLEKKYAKISKPKTIVMTEPKSEFSNKPINVNFKSITKRPDDIAVIIGNANYEKMGKDIPNVNPAYADAEGIKQYFMQALGVKEGNIIYLKDATAAQLLGTFGDKESHKGQLYNWVKPNVSNVYVYYAGHGVPGGDKGNAYLVPTDADSQTIQFSGYPLSTLYSNLGKLTAKSITVILEACFSGASQAGNLFANSSPIVITAKKTMIPKNVKVISAGAVDQMASWEQDNSHGLFTKYFLKAMSGEGDKNNDGKVSDAELKEYLSDTMTYYARRYYGRDQKVQIHNGG